MLLLETHCNCAIKGTLLDINDMTDRSQCHSGLTPQLLRPSDPFLLPFTISNHTTSLLRYASTATRPPTASHPCLAYSPLCLTPVDAVIDLARSKRQYTARHHSGLPPTNNGGPHRPAKLQQRQQQRPSGGGFNSDKRSRQPMHFLALPIGHHPELHNAISALT
jgi:hypothetical protein